MKRRQYLQSVGASVALPFTSVETQEDQEEEQKEENRQPVYATVDILGYNLNLAHISAPSDLVSRANYLYTASGSVRLSTGEKETEWEIVNALVDGSVGSIRIDDTEARKWDEFSLERVGLLYTGSSEHSYLDVYSEQEDLNRSKVEATESSEIDIGRDEESVPIFEVDPRFII